MNDPSTPARVTTYDPVTGESERGWRRVRLLARLRALQTYADRRTFADAMWATFGRGES